MRRRLILPLVLVAVTAVTAAIVVIGQDRPEYTTAAPRAYSLYVQGEERANAFQFARAESLLRAAIALDPGFAMAHAALGEVLASRALGGAAKHERVLADSLASRLPREDERLLVRVRLLTLELPGQSGPDSLIARAALRLPRHPLVLRARALRARAAGDAAAEEAAWREVLRFDPNYARAYNWLGYLAAGQGRYLEGLSYLRRYAFLAPDVANAHDSLGELYAWTGELDAAEQEYRQALQLQPDFYPSLLGLARVYVAQGRLRRALEILDGTRAQFAGTGIAHYIDTYTAGLLVEFGYPREAVPALARLSVESPKSPDAAWLRALVGIGAGRVAAGAALGDSLTAVRRADPAYAASAATRRRVECLAAALQARIAAARGDTALEAAAWTRAVAGAATVPPHERWSLEWRRAESLARLGHPGAALAQTRDILATNPRLAGPLLLQTRCLLALGRPEEARAALVSLDAALARADADLPVVAAADSLRRLVGARPPA